MIECKASKHTFDAKFSDDPLTQAKNGYSQIINGVMQVWRFFAHVRTFKFTQKKISDDAIGVVLTLDKWLEVNPSMITKVLGEAASQVKSKYPEVNAVDMKRPLVICSAQDIIDIMFITDWTRFSDCLQKAATVEFRGWDIRSLLLQQGDALGPKEMPNFAETLLPWLSKINSGDRTPSS